MYSGYSHLDSYLKSKDNGWRDQYTRPKENDQYNVNSTLYSSRYNSQTSHQNDLYSSLPSSSQQNQYSSLSSGTHEDRYNYIPENDVNKNTAFTVQSDKYTNSYSNHQSDMYSKSSINPDIDRIGNPQMYSHTNSYSPLMSYHKSDANNNVSAMVGREEKIEIPDLTSEDMGKRRSPSSALKYKANSYKEQDYAVTTEKESDTFTDAAMIRNVGDTLNEKVDDLLIRFDSSQNNHQRSKNVNYANGNDLNNDKNRWPPDENDRGIDLRWPQEDFKVNEIYRGEALRYTNEESERNLNHEGNESLSWVHDERKRREIYGGKVDPIYMNDRTYISESNGDLRWPDIKGGEGIDSTRLAKLSDEEGSFDVRPSVENLKEVNKKYETRVDLREEIHIDINMNKQREYELKVERNLLDDTNNESDSGSDEDTTSSPSKDIREKIINEMEEERDRELKLQKEYEMRGLQSNSKNSSSKDAMGYNIGDFAIDENNYRKNQKPAVTGYHSEHNDPSSGSKSPTIKREIHSIKNMWKGKRIPEEQAKELVQLQQILSNSDLLLDSNSNYMIEIIKDEDSAQKDIHIKIFKEIGEINNHQTQLKNEDFKTNNNIYHKIEIKHQNNIYYIANKLNRKHQNSTKKENSVTRTGETEVPWLNSKNDKQSFIPRNKSIGVNETDSLDGYEETSKGKRHKNSKVYRKNISNGIDDENIFLRNDLVELKQTDKSDSQENMKWQNGTEKQIKQSDNLLTIANANDELDENLSHANEENVKRDNITGRRLADMDKQKFGSRDDLVAFLGTNNDSTEEELMTTSNEETQIQRIKLPEVFTAASNSEPINDKINARHVKVKMETNEINKGNPKNAEPRDRYSNKQELIQINMQSNYEDGIMSRDVSLTNQTNTNIEFPEKTHSNSYNTIHRNRNEINNPVNTNLPHRVITRDINQQDEIAINQQDEIADSSIIRDKTPLISTHSHIRAIKNLSEIPYQEQVQYIAYKGNSRDGMKSDMNEEDNMLSEDIGKKDNYSKEKTAHGHRNLQNPTETIILKDTVASFDFVKKVKRWEKKIAKNIATK